MSTPCAKCSYVNISSARFCNGCGSALAQLPPHAQNTAMAANFGTQQSSTAMLWTCTWCCISDIDANCKNCPKCRSDRAYCGKDQVATYHQGQQSEQYRTWKPRTWNTWEPRQKQKCEYVSCSTCGYDRNLTYYKWCWRCKKSFAPVSNSPFDPNGAAAIDAANQKAAPSPFQNNTSTVPNAAAPNPTQQTPKSPFQPYSGEVQRIKHDGTVLVSGKYVQIDKSEIKQYVDALSLRCTDVEVSIADFADLSDTDRESLTDVESYKKNAKECVDGIDRIIGALMLHQRHVGQQLALATQKHKEIALKTRESVASTEHTASTAVTAIQQIMLSCPYDIKGMLQKTINEIGQHEQEKINPKREKWGNELPQVPESDSDITGDLKSSDNSVKASPKTTPRQSDDEKPPRKRLKEKGPCYNYEISELTAIELSLVDLLSKTQRKIFRHVHEAGNYAKCRQILSDHARSGRQSRQRGRQPY